MRFIILAGLLTVMPLASHAATKCDHPAKPGFPDPATVDPAVAEKLDASMQKYAAGMTAYVQCLGKEAQDAQAEATDAIDFYNQKFLPVYNKRATSP